MNTTASPPQLKGHNRRLGQAGEDLTVGFLGQRGFQVLDRNWRCRQGEVDVVALDPGGKLAFIEVKTRSSHRCGTPAAAVTGRKLARMRQVAAAWLRDHSQVSHRGVRLDLMCITWDGQGVPRCDYRQAIS